MEPIDFKTQAKARTLTREWMLKVALLWVFLLILQWLPAEGQQDIKPRMSPGEDSNRRAQHITGIPKVCTGYTSKWGTESEPQGL